MAQAAQIAYLLRFLWYANLRPIARLGPWGLCAVSVMSAT
jgi:hypothetical protein